MAFNPLQSFNQGFQGGQMQRQQQLGNQISSLQQSLAGQVGQGGFKPSESLDFEKLSVLDPQSAQRIRTNFESLSKDRKKAYHEDLQEGLRALEAGDSNKFLGIMGDRLNAIEGLKGDPTGTQFLLDKFNNGEIPELIEGLKRTEQAGIVSGLLPDPETRKAKIIRSLATGRITKTATQKDFSTFQDLLLKAKESGTDKDKIKAERFGRAARFIRETEQEKSDIKVTETERKEVAKANVARRQGFIDSGIEAANGAANISRALTLLDEVKTGGFDNLALKAKRLFGIEGADEGELSNLMGKAVLAQLKPIFGAAFTAREGEALTAIEAKFSNSAANNKRLLGNVLKIINRSARRGIAAAENQGDEFTANEIREALAFRLEDKLSTNETKALNSSALGREISEQDITDTLQANPNLTRDQLLQQLGIN